MAKRLAGLAVALAVAAAFPAPAAAEQERTSSPGREDAMVEFLTAEVAAQRGETGPRSPQWAASRARCATRSRAPRGRARDPRPRDGAGPRDGDAPGRARDRIRPSARELVASLVASRGDLERRAKPSRDSWTRARTSPSCSPSSRYFFGKYADKGAVLEATRSITVALPEARGVALCPRRGRAGRGQAGPREVRVRGRARHEARLGAGSHPACPGAEEGRARGRDPVLPLLRRAQPRCPGRAPAARARASRSAAKRRGEAGVPGRRAALRVGPQVPYAIGLLSLQLEDFAGAEVAFRRALGMGHPDPGAVYLGLGQAAESAKHFDEALDWYRKVDSGDWMRAQMRIATLIAKRDGLAKGAPTCKGSSRAPRTTASR